MLMIGYPGFCFNTEGMFLGEIVNDTIPYVGSGLDDSPILLYHNFIATWFLPHNRLEKGFVKYMGNDGSVDPDLKFTALGRTLDAFQHYCIAVSKKSFMVCDLQGGYEVPISTSIDISALISIRYIRSLLWKIKPASIRKCEIPALPAHIQSHDCLHN
jgi:Alpha-kinase family